MVLEVFNSVESTAEYREKSHVKTPVLSPQLWSSSILPAHPEVRKITLAYYSASGSQDEIQHFTVTQVCNGEYFKNGTHPPSTIGNLTCSISSIVETDVPQQLGFEPSLENPMAFPMFDLSCPISDENTSIIIDVLDDLEKDWYVSASGRSYHVIISKPTPLLMLPYEWGDMLCRFSRISGNDFARRRGEEIANTLKTNTATTFGLRMSAVKLLSQTFVEIESDHGGFDEFSKTSSYIDWGHIGYSLSGLLNFFRGESPGMGYLRLGYKGHTPPPILVAKTIGGKHTSFDIPDGYFSKQPHLL